jgi:hypothetical protein
MPGNIRLSKARISMSGEQGASRIPDANPQEYRCGKRAQLLVSATPENRALIIFTGSHLSDRFADMYH